MNDFLFFDELPSSQTWLVEKTKTGESVPPVCVVVARQTAGIGSRGNGWEQEEDTLNFSFSFKTSDLPADLPAQSFSIFFGFLFKEVLVSKNPGVWLKWPNDLYVGESKIGGIISNLTQGIVVCGIGVNVSGKKFASLGTDIPKNAVLREFFDKIENTRSWKEIFSKYRLEFHKNLKFSFHSKDETLDLKNASLLPDGGIYLNGKKFYGNR